MKGTPFTALALLAGIFLPMMSACAREALIVSVEATLKPTHCDLELTAANNTQRPVVVEFRSAQRFDFYAKDFNGRIIWQWSHERVFADEQSKETLQPGEILKYKAKWPYVRNDGHRVKGGKYALMGALCAQPQNEYSKVVEVAVPDAHAAVPLNP